MKNKINKVKGNKILQKE